VPLLSLDSAGLYGSLLGESEARLAEALEIAEKMSPCILLIDEVERGFSNGQGDRDGGTQERVLGKMLTWMASKTASVYVVMTANFADRLPAALIRKGRIDEIFCLGFPSVEERKAVFDYYLTKAEPHQVTENDVKQLVQATDGWVPSEIEACVTAARFTAFAGCRPVQTFDLVNEVSRTVPISQSMRSQVEHMLDWASEYARQTDYPDTDTSETDTRIIRA
jgi:SpoVK/Ycf46/Vps4 family AAA+-type ATPase